ncbi:MAG: peptide ABC transporter substrate-binding protein [Rhodobacter sp.]|nr:peptide ABC transporter substrate-binding protein [Rhodobacter sp.]MCY4169130.1 peptide ABC transporter substrate-binding protein [Rhodobacter sp.]MCY4240331.1 peptide ABC transporter substrate-binding protein [Rhodobacter sp.]
MRLTKHLAACAALAMSWPAAAQEAVFPGDSTSGTYHDYMKTVYSRAGYPENSQLPLTSFDADFNLHGLGAESWVQSDDGQTWTITLRDGLKFSDGHPLTAEDYVFALERAATSGYDFAWYWDFAGGIDGWSAVTSGDAGLESLGVRAVDDLTIEVRTVSPRPFWPSVASLWYPVPKHVWDEHGDDYAANVDTLVASGAYMVESWEKNDNSMTFVPNPEYTGPWPATLERLEINPSLGAAEVGLPAYLAGELKMAYLNRGQIPFMERREPENVRRNAIFAVSYISFDLDAVPFDNVDVRKALAYAVDREEMTGTVLSGLAIPAGSILSPDYPGHNAGIAAQAVFDPERARAHLAAAGYPNGEGFPKVEIWYRDQGGYNGAITAPMLQYLQAEYKEHLGIDMDLRVMPTRDWMQALLSEENNLFLSPYEFDYIDPSNFFGIFYDGGRHDHRLPEYDRLVAEAGSASDWETRLDLYAKAERLLLHENVSVIPLVHPIQTFVLSGDVKGDSTVINANGLSPTPRVTPFFYTHLTVD